MIERFESRLSLFSNRPNEITDSPQTSRSIPSRKRGSSDDPEKVPDLNKKSKLAESDSNGNVVQNFVQILQSLIPADQNLSRKFSAKILYLLGLSIDSFQRLKGEQKVLMTYDVFLESKKTCPNNAPTLHIQIHGSINHFVAENHEVLLRHQKNAHLVYYPEVQPLSYQQFCALLKRIVATIQAQVPAVDQDAVLSQLHHSWLTRIIADRVLSPTDLLRLKKPLLPEPKRVEAPHANREVGIHQTVHGLIHVPADQFARWIHQLKSQFVTPGDFVDHVTNQNTKGFTALNTAIFEVKLHNIKAFLQLIMPLFGNDKVKSRGFLLHKTSDKLTYLHQIALSGDLSVLKFFTQILKTELDHEGYARALRARSAFFYIPGCPPEHPNATLINSFLNNEREHYQLEQLTGQNEDGFFNEGSDPLDYVPVARP